MDQPSKFAQELAEQMSTEEKIESAKKVIAKRLSVQAGLREGTLTFDQYKKLPLALQKLYARRFNGAPKRPDELRAEKTRKLNQKKRRKMAKKARTRNRGK